MLYKKTSDYDIRLSPRNSFNCMIVPNDFNFKNEKSRHLLWEWKILA